ELLDGTIPDTVNPANYEITGPAQAQLPVTGVQLRPDGRSVLLSFAGSVLFASNTNYRLAVSNIQDPEGNRIAAGTATDFFVSPWSRGFLQLEFYDHIAGTTIQDLLDHTNFIGMAPDELHLMTAFDTRTVFPDDDLDHFGGRICGVFFPPASGNWRFYLSSADNSQLYFNPSGTSANQAVLLLEETSCCHDFGVHVSSPQALVADRPCYIEARFPAAIGG